jgi:7-carboxy-7-deazaguanine synthase
VPPRPSRRSRTRFASSAVRIAEIYKSIQGEGFLTGTPSAFVRTSGCNLRCWFCDTPFASFQPEGDDLPVGEILRRVTSLATGHVVVTGGEPMIHRESAALCEGLAAEGRHITIETAGTVYLPVKCDLLSLSPKLAGSAPPAETYPDWRPRHERARHAPDVVRRWIAEHAYQVKFVIDAPADCEQVERYLDEVPEIDRRRVLLMPQGIDRQTLARTAAWLEPYCRQHDYHYCPRMHIEWFGYQRAT